jgi:penicillin-binding protein 2
LPFAVAGKTGTAQWNTNKQNHAWFTSFGPFEHPEIVLTILVEEGGEGGIASAPIARDFYSWWWSYTHGAAPQHNIVDKRIDKAA